MSELLDIEDAPALVKNTLFKYRVRSDPAVRALISHIAAASEGVVAARGNTRPTHRHWTDTSAIDFSLDIALPVSRRRIQVFRHGFRAGIGLKFEQHISDMGADRGLGEGKPFGNVGGLHALAQKAQNLALAVAETIH